jgi:hypothetical protein
MIMKMHAFVVGRGAGEVQCANPPHAFAKVVPARARPAPGSTDRAAQEQVLV